MENDLAGRHRVSCATVLNCAVDQGFLTLGRYRGALADSDTLTAVTYSVMMPTIQIVSADI